MIPRQIVTSGFLAGALIRTRFAPPLLICSSALSRLVKKPVDSSTTSTPRSFQGRLRRIAFLQNLNLVAADDDVFLVVADFAIELAVDRVPFEQVRKGMRVGEIVDGARCA